MAAASYAAVRGYPILLTWQNRLPEDTTEAISELGLQTAIISGGTGVISEGIEKTLAGQLQQVRRIAGADRYETSAALAEEFLSQEQGYNRYYYFWRTRCDQSGNRVLASRH